MKSQWFRNLLGLTEVERASANYHCSANFQRIKSCLSLILLFYWLSNHSLYKDFQGHYHHKCIWGYKHRAEPSRKYNILFLNLFHTVYHWSSIWHSESNLYKTLLFRMCKYLCFKTLFINVAIALKPVQDLMNNFVLSASVWNGLLKVMLSLHLHPNHLFRHIAKNKHLSFSEGEASEDISYLLESIPLEVYSVNYLISRNTTI